MLHGIILKGKLDFYLQKSISPRFGGNFLSKGLGAPFSLLLSFKPHIGPGPRLGRWEYRSFILSDKTVLPVVVTFTHLSICRCGSRTDGQSGGKGSVLVKCSRSGHISRLHMSCRFWRVLRTMHRYKIIIFLFLSTQARADKVDCPTYFLPCKFHFYLQIVNLKELVNSPLFVKSKSFYYSVIMQLSANLCIYLKGMFKTLGNMLI